MTPDFAQFLLATPKAERVGKVFKLTRAQTGQPIGIVKSGRDRRQDWPDGGGSCQ